MRRAIGIFVGDAAHPVGVLRFDAQGARRSAGVEYHPNWLTAETAFAIDPNLPLASGMQFHRQTRHGSIFHGAIADTEPDGWGRRVILRDHAKRRRAAGRTGSESGAGTSLSPLDLLLAVDDASRVGALRFQDEHGVFQRASEAGRRTVPPLIELPMLLSATHAVENHTEAEEDLAYLLGRGTSLGGLRPKCSVVDDDGRLSIGKFPSAGDDRAVTKGEVLALRLASAAGIRAAEARLIESAGEPVALIRRFDRPEQGGRIMYVSAATMLGAEQDEPAEHTYAEIVDVLRRYSADVRSDIEELWRRVAFSIPQRRTPGYAGVAVAV